MLLVNRHKLGPKPEPDYSHLHVSMLTAARANPPGWLDHGVKLCLYNPIMKRSLFVALLAVVVSPAFGAFDTYMEFKGGEIARTVPAARTEQIAILSFGSPTLSASEIGSGMMPAGHRQWSPFLVRRSVDKASPLLREYCANGKHVNFSITRVERSATGSQPKVLYTINFTGAVLSKYSTSSGGDNPTESFSFTFQKITWTYTNGGKTAMDSWDAK